MPLTSGPLTRRDFLISSATALGALPTVAPAANALATVTTAIPIIDTHTHFYDPTRPEGVPWPGRDDKLLYRQVLPQHYRKITAAEGVAGTVVVEASSWVEDNQWLLDLAQRDPLLVAIVGHLEPGTEQFAAQLERFAAIPLFRGIRIGHGLLKDRLSNALFLDDLRRFARLGLALDINGGPDMLADIARLAAKMDTLKIVVNHLANVRIDGKSPPSDWQTGMKDAAAHPRVWCKVSALVEGASQPEKQSPGELDFYRPVLDVAWTTFGEQRLVYGSNWPVSERFAPYSTVQKLAVAFAKSHGEEVARRVLHDNAKEVYDWPERKSE